MRFEYGFIRYLTAECIRKEYCARRKWRAPQGVNWTTSYMHSQAEHWLHESECSAGRGQWQQDWTSSTWSLYKREQKENAQLIQLAYNVPFNFLKYACVHIKFPLCNILPELVWVWNYVLKHVQKIFGGEYMCARSFLVCARLTTCVRTHTRSALEGTLIACRQHKRRIQQ